MTIKELQKKKQDGQKITMLTAYDYPMAHFIDQAGIDIILVGDSVANVVLGLESTRDVDMAIMLHHAKAVRRGVKNALVVGDMPFESYQKDISKSVENAKRFVNEAGCDSIKLEWFDQAAQVAKSIVDAGVPVMGHVGLTPQTAESFKVQGKDAESARKIMAHAKELEESGCSSIVLECVPAKIAEMITQQLSIPTIGIGAGVHCDGQVLVTHDILGLFDRYKPKFVKQYGNLGKMMTESIKQFADEVQMGQFPDDQYSFSIQQKELDEFVSSL